MVETEDLKLKLYGKGGRTKKSVKVKDLFGEDDMPRPYAVEGMVCHLTFKCFSCFSTVTHSIPIASSYAEELKERREGMSTFAPWSPEYPGTVDDLPLTPSERGEIKKRMESLGYF